MDKKEKLSCAKKELAAAGCREAEINNTVSCKQPVDDRKHVQILPN
jgi:hypothetical protein